jgi:serine/threonine protein kinase
VIFSYPVIGKQVGNYRINLQLGEDNLGILYNGHHLAGSYPVVLRHFAAQFTDVGLVARYVDLSRVAASMNHPGIWAVRESVWSGRNAFVAGDHLPTGETLDRILARDGRLWPELVVKLGWQLASALAAAHSANVFHCRLDGDSVFCFPDPAAPGGYRTMIMDFGVAAFLDSGAPDWRSPKVQAFGLPFYMPPEQCRAGMVDYRGDVYSLGALLFHMATGQPPHPGDTPQAIASAHQTGALRSLQSIDPALPYELDQLVQRMCAKDVAARPSMPEVAFELERIALKYWAAPTSERTVQLDLKIGAPPPVVDALPPGEAEARRLPIVPAAIVVGGLAALGIALAIIKPWADRSPPPAPAPAVVEEKAAEPPPPPPVAPPLPKYEPPPPKPESELEKQVKGARAALLDGRAADAQAAYRAAQKLEPKNPEVLLLGKQLRSEPANKRLHDELVKAAGQHDVAAASRRLARIPPDSLFYAPAQRAFEKLKRDFLHVKIAEAKALADTHACARIAPVEKQVAALFPESAAEIAAIARTCK